MCRCREVGQHTTGVRDRLDRLRNGRRFLVGRVAFLFVLRFEGPRRAGLAGGFGGHVILRRLQGFLALDLLVCAIGTSASAEKAFDDAAHNGAFQIFLLGGVIHQRQFCLPPLQPRLHGFFCGTGHHAKRRTRADTLGDNGHRLIDTDLGGVLDRFRGGWRDRLTGYLRAIVQCADDTQADLVGDGFDTGTKRRRSVSLAPTFDVAMLRDLSLGVGVEHLRRVAKRAANEAADNAADDRARSRANATEGSANGRADGRARTCASGHAAKAKRHGWGRLADGPGDGVRLVGVAVEEGTFRRGIGIALCPLLLRRLFPLLGSGCIAQAFEGGLDRGIDTGLYLVEATRNAATGNGQDAGGFFFRNFRFGGSLRRSRRQVLVDANRLGWRRLRAADLEDDRRSIWTTREIFSHAYEPVTSTSVSSGLTTSPRMKLLCIARMMASCFFALSASSSGE